MSITLSIILFFPFPSFSFLFLLSLLYPFRISLSFVPSFPFAVLPVRGSWSLLASLFPSSLVSAWPLASLVFPLSLAFTLSSENIQSTTHCLHHSSSLPKAYSGQCARAREHASTALPFSGFGSSFLVVVCPRSLRSTLDRCAFIVVVVAFVLVVVVVVVVAVRIHTHN